MSKRTFWHYSGDVNIEHGGVFYNFDNWQYDYVDFVRVVPCSDAGGPDNEYWIEVGHVNLQSDPKRVKAALDCIGMRDDQFEAMTRARARHVLFDAYLAYGYYDHPESRRIRIGKEPDSHSRHWDERQPDDILRGNTSLYRHVRRIVRNAGF